MLLIFLISPLSVYSHPFLLRPSVFKTSPTQPFSFASPRTEFSTLYSFLHLSSLLQYALSLSKIWSYPYCRNLLSELQNHTADCLGLTAALNLT